MKLAILFSLFIFCMTYSIIKLENKHRDEELHISLCERAYSSCKDYRMSEYDCDWNEIWVCIHR